MSDSLCAFTVKSILLSFTVFNFKTIWSIFRQKSYLWTLLGVLSFDFVGFESCEIVGGGLASVLENLGPNPDSATQLEAASLFLRAFISSLRRKA